MACRVLLTSNMQDLPSISRVVQGIVIYIRRLPFRTSALRREGGTFNSIFADILNGSPLRLRDFHNLPSAPDIRKLWDTSVLCWVFLQNHSWVRHCNLGWHFFPFKSGVSQLSVDQISRNFAYFWFNLRSYIPQKISKSVYRRLRKRNFWCQKH